MDEQPTDTTAPRSILSSEEIAARLCILECLTLNAAVSVTELIARHENLTLDGVRTHLALIHKFMLDSLLETNSKETFEAGLPHASTAIQAIFANVKQALRASETAPVPCPAADISGPGLGDKVN